MDALKQVNALVAFLLEIVMLISFGYWGHKVGQGSLAKWTLAITLPVAAIVVWSLFFAPEATWRLTLWPGVVGSLGLFLLSALALERAGLRAMGVVAAMIAVVNAALALAWKQL